MDPRNRADEALARSRARGAFVVTPDSATSPMDAAQTVRIPRETVRELDGADPNSTTVIQDSHDRSRQADEPARRASEGARPVRAEYEDETPTAPHGITPHDARNAPQRFD
ncbi:hypothetical protein [Actinopolyspora mortivallis]|uniref:hypothetical protein n=1 Tax=Actinopolyspora mortivallis TaxID=33906 RepID=UPI0003669F42|nr:hypothetical protein [Actinopolyspora mortivallis]